MMTSEVYDGHRRSAVAEPVIAGTELPIGLTPLEQTLYRRLISEECGRLEQEFLPESLVHQAISTWADQSDCADAGAAQ